jgi:P27 family predicted phage terminase small subunit
MARPRKPTHLKLVTGTDRPDRRPAIEPKPRRARPGAPAHLSASAKAGWRAFSVILDRMGVLTEADGPALEGLCEAYADVRRARASLAAADGLYYETINKAGGLMLRTRPEVAIISDADRRLAMWFAKFGLTPADRSRVSANLQDSGNEFAEFG